MTNKPIDKIVLTVVVLLLVCVTALNLFQSERPTVSETENRTLATMPEFSVSDLLSGKYFAGIGDFFSDTFWQRDAMVSVSKKIDTLKSLSLIYSKEGISVIIDPNPTHTTEPEEVTLPSVPTVPTTPPTTAPPETTFDPSDFTEPPEAIPIVLSSDSVSFTTDATYLLIATVGEGYRDLHWEMEGSESITFTDNGDGSVTIEGTDDGEATITATVTGPNGAYQAVCDVFVKKLVITKPVEEAADFLPNGMIIYNGAAHSQSYFSQTYGTAFAQLYDLYAKCFPDSQMSVVVAPLSTITITDPEVSQHISDQCSILDRLEAEIIGDVNFVNLKDVYLAHADEYLYFRSDHHWTHRGAYYAYSEFAKSVGLTPTPIDDFEKVILTENYIGSMYNYTGDQRVASFYDTVEAYMPTKNNIMKIHYADGGVNQVDNCILTYIRNYVAFIAGDNPYTVINVPENPQDKNILVIKDSFGNAFVTYLAEHYGNIVVIDPRHADMNIYDFYNTYNFTDIVFMVNSSSGNTGAWYNYLAGLLN